MKFVNRERELKQLEEYYELSKKRLNTVAISGLRRVGKTMLINEFLKNKKAIYFFVYESKTSTELLEEFSQELKNAKITTELERLTTWSDFFKVLFERCHNYVIVFDEFQNFYTIDKSVYSMMQKNIDENQETPINLIVLGSLIGLFKKIFEDKKQPLYGRFNVKISLKPFTLKNSTKIMEHLGYHDPEKMLETYALFGGFPKYYAAIEQFQLADKNIFQTIEYLFIQENAPLENEVLDILKQEFGRRSPLYYSILHAIASGKTKLNEIATHCGSKESSITRHLLELEEKFELLTSLKPWGNKKNTRYAIRHPLIAFWFKFVYSKYSKYSLKKTKDIMDDIKRDFNTFLGTRFEETCRNYLAELNAQDGLPFKIDHLGNWWGTQRSENERKEIEIDLVGLNNKTKQVLFAECKWKNNVDPIEITNELDKKTNALQWHNDNRIEAFAIFAKSFSKKISAHQGKKVYCYDFSDIEKTLKTTQ